MRDWYFIGTEGVSQLCLSFPNGPNKCPNRDLIGGSCPNVIPVRERDIPLLETEISLGGGGL